MGLSKANIATILVLGLAAFIAISAFRAGVSMDNAAVERMNADRAKAEGTNWSVVDACEKLIAREVVLTAFQVAECSNVGVHVLEPNTPDEPTTAGD